MSLFREDLTELLPQLRAYARSLTRGDMSLADDLVQDAVVNALRAEHQYTPGTNLKAWLFHHPSQSLQQRDRAQAYNLQRW